MEGVGSRALRVRSVRLALERREAIFSGGGGGLEFNCERREVRVEIDADMMEIVGIPVFCEIFEIDIQYQEGEILLVLKQSFAVSPTVSMKRSYASKIPFTKIRPFLLNRSLLAIDMAIKIATQLFQTIYIFSSHLVNAFDIIYGVLRTSQWKTVQKSIQSQLPSIFPSCQ